MNQRSVEGFDEWLCEIKAALGKHDAPYAVNLIVHQTNSRLQSDLERCVEHRVPIVITSFGADLSVVESIKAYGGVVFHDVINRRHAEKALAAGVDGLILVCGGAGGHAGKLNPIAFVREIRGFYDGCIMLSGGITDGYGIAAARSMGADLAYVGTRFIATDESLVDIRYKQMIIDSQINDVIYTPNVSGVPANFLSQSLREAGYDPKSEARPYKPNMDEELNHQHRAWRDIWSAGQGVGSIVDVVPVSSLVDLLKLEYQSAIENLQFT